MHLNRRPARDDERGAVAILVAASLVVLCMSCAMAVDLGNVGQLHRHAQYTVDDAAISGANLLWQGDSVTQVVSATEAYVNENWGNLSSSAWDTCPSSDIPSGFSAPAASGENCITFNGADTAITVEIPPRPVPFTVARLGGFTSGTVEAEASATIPPAYPPCALCLLGPGGIGIGLKGSGSFAVTDSAGSGEAGIVVDSNAPDAINVSGKSGSISAPSIGVVGNVHAASSVFSPIPTVGVNPVPDPLAFLAPPTPATTTILPAVSSGTVAPGNYAGISASSNGTTTLESGTYFLTGPLASSGGGTITTSGPVLIYFTCSSGNQLAACTSPGQAGGSINEGGNSTISLDPMTTGPYAGLTIFFDRNDDSGISLAGTPALTGTIYAKDSALTLSGTPGTLSSLIVVSSASINGTASVTVNYDKSQNIALPPGVPYLCSTTASNC